MMMHDVVMRRTNPVILDVAMRAAMTDDLARGDPLEALAVADDPHDMAIARRRR
jgi:hypothetical protein